MSQMLTEIQQNLNKILGPTHDFKVAWLHPKEFKPNWEAGESIDADCKIIVEGNKEVAIQRDFCALKQGQRILLVADPKIPDGFQNFLRWIVPRELAKQNKFVLHSSCVVDKYDQAFLFLGPSGAGKTTMASLATEYTVLGDDMNTVKIENGELWVMPSGLGQRIEAPRSMRRWFKVKKVFWLVQSRNLKQSKVSAARAYRYYSVSLANMFWPHLKNDQVENLQQVLKSMVSASEIWDLEFPKTPNLWNQLKEYL